MSAVESRQMDRIAPTRRPDRKVRGYQQWRSLLFMHWPVPFSALRPLIPPSLEIDLYQGTAYVGVVPFLMQGVRPSWCPPALAFRFPETNVRTYVYHNDQPGVYFFSLDAASRIAVWAARRFWELPYYLAEMRVERQDHEIHYWSRRHQHPGRLDVRCQLGSMLGPSQPGTAEFFFLERYLLYVQRRGQLYVGQVHHAPYPAQQAEVLEVEDELVAAANLGVVTGRPEFTHFAAGVDVEVFGLRAVTG